MSKTVFFDIDGTLVSFETHRIPPSTIEALEAAHAKGLWHLYVQDVPEPV